MSVCLGGCEFFLYVEICKKCSVLITDTTKHASTIGWENCNCSLEKREMLWNFDGVEERYEKKFGNT